MTTSISRILCPVDFSDASRHALDHAEALTRWFGARLTALHVVPPVPVVSPVADPLGLPPVPWRPEDLEALRTRVVRFAEQEGNERAEAVCVEGNPAREVVRQAAALGADLVVMGSHGRSGAERLLMGSVAERVIRHAPCPVMTVPAMAPDAVPLGPPLYARMLVAVDFSRCSTHALTWAASFARDVEARVKVAHVVEPFPDYVGAIGTGLDLGREQEAAREQLHALVQKAVAGPLQVSEAVTVGHPAREILAMAQEERVELIVTGVHGRNAADLLFFGSTTNRILRESRCPVLTVRAVET
ncbi:MAG: universal stress protein [Acidimicrobiia bacterium]|nr:universal stress protein [Acidimicrobiia bacterium]